VVCGCFVVVLGIGFGGVCWGGCGCLCSFVCWVWIGVVLGQRWVVVGVGGCGMGVWFGVGGWVFGRLGVVVSVSGVLFFFVLVLSWVVV